MARARNIKPKFFQNDALGELDPLARLFFIGLWTVADYRGCLEFRPKRLKAQLLPYDECNIDTLATALDKSGFIAIYSVQGQKYVKILKFVEHQNPHKNERDAGSEIPDVSENDREINELTQDGSTPEKDGINRDKDGSDRAESLFPLTESLTLNPSIPAVAVKVVRQKDRDQLDDAEFIAAWNDYPKRPGASRADAFKAWASLIRKGVAPSAILAGVRRYAEYVKQAGTDPQYIKQPVTFFGPGAHYLADWTFVARSGAPQPSDKFQVAGLDHSSTNEAMQASMKRHNIVIPDGEIEF